MGTSPSGSGIMLANCNEAVIHNNEIGRNAHYGVQIAESKNIAVTGNLLEGNDRSGVIIELLSSGSANISVNHNKIRYNAGYGLEAYSVRDLRTTGNSYAQNKSGEAQIKSNRIIVME
jgi:parallel beta-helix repeat protein